MTPTAARRERPRETWIAYGYLSAVGFVLYATGALTPYLRDDLGLSATEAALHPSAVALGLVSAGVIHDLVERRFGRRRAGALAVAALGAGGIGLSVGLALPITLAAAFAIGLGAGSMLAAVNIVLGRAGSGAEARLARANAWSLLVSMMAPLLIAALAVSPLGWRAVPLLPLLATLALEAAGGGLPGAAAHPVTDGSADLAPDIGMDVAPDIAMDVAPDITAPSTASTTAIGVSASAEGLRGTHPTGRLTRGFWLAWLFVVTVASIEFAYVVWGSSLLVARTGVSRETGTALATLFLGAMLAGRILLGLGRLGGYRSVPWVEIALGMSAVGGVVTWLAGDPALSAIGLLLAGFGTATLYPQGIALALAHASGDEVAAGARLTLASGAAILSMPLILGATADGFGIAAGWPLVIALSAFALPLRRLSAGTR